MSQETNDLPKTIKRKMPKNTRRDSFYVSSDALKAEIRRFYETGKMSNELGVYIMKIIDGLATTQKFSSYTYLDEMKGDALLKIIRAINLKNVRIDGPSNAFSYFTTVTFHAFFNRIKQEKKCRATIEILQESLYDDLINENSFFREHILPASSLEGLDD